MTRKTEVKSINCTSCGAGLDVLGGGRVVTQVCGYCGSALDAQDNFKVLKKFTATARVQSPFTLGMTGTLQGIEFQIIGTLGFEERYGGQVWHWVDHQVFSPTHGYAFLSVEDGHFVFTRRYRKPLRPSWLSERTVENAENRPSVRSASNTYHYYETSTSRVTFAEGAFNWLPEIGERNTTVSVLSDTAMIGFTETKTEREVERSVYLPFAQTAASFGLSDVQAPTGIHPLSPFKEGVHQSFLTKLSIGAAAISLALTFYLATLMDGDTTIEEGYYVGRLPAEIPVEITQPNKLARIHVRADVNNSWAFVEIGLIDPEDVPVFEAGREIGRYSGRDGDGNWSEGSQNTTLRFRPTQSGMHTLEVNVNEAGTWSRTGSALSQIDVRVVQGASSPFWMICLTVAFGLLAVYQVGRKVVHNRRRWWGSDWVEEDDD